MSKLVFLDIDGVLINRKSPPQGVNEPTWARQTQQRFREHGLTAKVV